MRFLRPPILPRLLVIDPHIQRARGMGTEMTARRTDSEVPKATVRTLRPRPATDGPAFLSIADAAAMLGVSTSTLYRAISDGQFPAVRIRDRVIVPAKAIDAVTADALDGWDAKNVEQFGGAR
jgi:excisionase family DNA binding protein